MVKEVQEKQAQRFPCIESDARLLESLRGQNWLKSSEVVSTRIPVPYAQKSSGQLLDKLVLPKLESSSDFADSGSRYCCNYWCWIVCKRSVKFRYQAPEICQFVYTIKEKDERACATRHCAHVKPSYESRRQSCLAWTFEHSAAVIQYLDRIIISLCHPPFTPNILPRIICPIYGLYV